MANPIRLKRRVSGNAGAPATLLNGECAVNETENVVYYGKGLGQDGNATSIIAIAGDGVFATKSYVTSAISGLGGVTSVGLSLPNVFTVSGSPVTGSGTLSATLATQTANYVWSGPTEGSAAAPTFRALVAADIPTLTAAKISDLATTVQAYRLDQFAAPTSSVSMNNQKITGLATPTADGDAVSKSYADALRSGLDVKQSVRVATTANITLSGTQTIDGVSVIAGDRVLVKNQSTASDNGIYVVAAGSWSRSTDADSDAEVTAGLFVFVEDGSVNADTGWVLSTNAPITLGSTGLAFAQFSGAGQVTAGNGLTKTGASLDVVTADAGRIVVNSDSIDLATTGVSAGTYKSVTVDAYGRVTAGTNPTTLAGYGITDALSTTSDVDGGSY